MSRGKFPLAENRRLITVWGYVGGPEVILPDNGRVIGKCSYEKKNGELGYLYSIEIGDEIIDSSNKEELN